MRIFSMVMVLAFTWDLGSQELATLNKLKIIPNKGEQTTHISVVRLWGEQHIAISQFSAPEVNKER